MKYFAIVLFAILISLVCNAQVELNPHKTNIQTPPIVPCNPNTFWTAHYNPNGGFTSNISEFTLINSTITYNGEVATGCPGMSLAYANFNLLNGGWALFTLLIIFKITKCLCTTDQIGFHLGIPGQGTIMY